MGDPSRARRDPADPTDGLAHAAARSSQPGNCCRCLSAPIFTCSRHGRAQRRWTTWPACWVAGRSAADRWRHYRCFATCLLDRVLLLNDRVDLFEFTVHGEAALTAIREQHGGCFLFGAHLGSFEVVRAAGRHMADVRTAW